METITVTIDKSGNPTIEVSGVTGASCTDLTKGLERALGVVAEQTPNAEFYAEHNNTAEQG